MKNGTTFAGCPGQSPYTVTGPGQSGDASNARCDLPGPGLARKSVPLARVLGHDIARESGRHQHAEKSQIPGTPDVDRIRPGQRGTEPPQQPRHREDLAQLRGNRVAPAFRLRKDVDVAAREGQAVRRRRGVVAGSGDPHLGKQVGPHVDLASVRTVRKELASASGSAARGRPPRAAEGRATRAAPAEASPTESRAHARRPPYASGSAVMRRVAARGA